MHYYTLDILQRSFIFSAYFVDFAESYVIETTTVPTTEYISERVSGLQEDCIVDDDIDDVDGDNDNEESKWLDALEAGDLDDNGELKRERNIAALTARQVDPVINSVLLTLISRSRDN